MSEINRKDAESILLSGGFTCEIADLDEDFVRVVLPLRKMLTAGLLQKERETVEPMIKEKLELRAPIVLKKLLSRAKNVIIDQENLCAIWDLEQRESNEDFSEEIKDTERELLKANADLPQGETCEVNVFDKGELWDLSHGWHLKVRRAKGFKVAEIIFKFPSRKTEEGLQ